MTFVTLKTFVFIIDSRLTSFLVSSPFSLYMLNIDAGIIMNDSILYVDDDKLLTRAFSRLFRKQPFSISIAHSGQDAIKQLAKKNFAVIISDLRMPGMSGDHFLLHAHEQQPNAVKIMLSGYLSNFDNLDGNSATESWHCIHKPCFDDELVALIEDAVTAYQINDNEHLH